MCVRESEREGEKVCDGGEDRKKEGMKGGLYFIN